MLLVSPYSPAFTDNGILIKPHPQQGKRSLDEHFRRCEFHYYGQQCYLVNLGSFFFFITRGFTTNLVEATVDLPRKHLHRLQR